MRREGHIMEKVKLLECVNPIKNKWRVRWDVQENGDGTADYMEVELTHKPTDEEIKDLVKKWYNQQTDAAILSGFNYEGAPVWLSQENQYNLRLHTIWPSRRTEKRYQCHLSSALMKVQCTIRLKRLMNLQISTRKPLSIYKRYWKMAGIIKMQ